MGGLYDGLPLVFPSREAVLEKLVFDHGEELS